MQARISQIAVKIPDLPRENYAFVSEKSEIKAFGETDLPDHTA